MAFYHTHRPQQFSDLAGQDHIKTTLLNTLKLGRVGHAYLFAGPRGLGKTTTARLLAKAVNCQENDDLLSSRTRVEGNLKSNPEPCNKCQSCLAITNGSALDVLEIDGASNRGIDEIRDLREMVKFAPTKLAKKVIIIDEVHMLTKEAFNALLKTLEEPPDYLIFILATTEAHKVPATIQSRVQRFDFHRASEAIIASHLQKIAQIENKKITKEALGLMATLAEGSFRDGIVIFDQIASHSDAEITRLEVENILGLSNQQSILQFIEAIASGDRTTAFRVVDLYYSLGGDPTTFIGQAITEIRHRLRRSDNPKLIIWLSDLLKAFDQLKISPSPLLPLELFIITHTNHQSLNQKEILVDTISSQTESPIEIKSAPIPTEEKSTLVAAHRGEVSEPVWHKLIAKLREKNTPLAAVLEGSHLVGADDQTITIAVKFKFHQQKICDQKNRPIIETSLRELTGKSLKLICKIDTQYVRKRETIEESANLVDSALDIFEGE